MATEDQKRANQEWEQQRKAHQAALSKCWGACDTKDVDQLRELFQSGQLDRSDAENAIGATIEDDWLEGTRCLLEQGVDPTAASWKLIGCRSLGMYKLWDEFGLDFKAKGHDLLHYVVDHREIVDFLLDRGVDINRPVKRNIAKGDRDDTVEVLNKAAALGDIELFDHLVARGADPSRSIALHTATQCEDQVKAAAMVTHLIKKHGFDVESDEGCGGLRDFFSSLPEQEGTPLNFAARYHNTAAAEVLLKNGAASQPLPLLMAVNKKATSILKLLLAAGADPMHGLEAATSCNNLEAAELCLEYGADPVQAEQYQSMRLSDPGIMVNEMSSEMKNLLSEWKSRREGKIKDTDVKA